MIREELERYIAAWEHRANNVETHGGIQSALLGCASDVRRLLDRHASTEPGNPPDGEPSVLPPLRHPPDLPKGIE